MHAQSRDLDLISQCMWNLEYSTNEPIHKKRNSLTDTENRLVVAKGGDGGDAGKDWECGIGDVNYYI